MYHRQPHPDLPAIPEETLTPNSSTRDSPVDDDNTPHEEIEDGILDDSSNAESYANSYAFTLDNVGFDEENSLVGSVVGSVIGTNANFGNGSPKASVVHTPPSQYSPGRISKHERKLHRETCRTLGLPYSEDTLDSSPSSGSESTSLGKSSILGSISVSSGSNPGSTDELDRKRKIDKLWPWPGKSNSNSPTTVPLDKMNSTSGKDDEAKEASKKLSLAKFSETTAAYTNRMKVAMAAFNERIEQAYERSKQTTQPTQKEDDKSNQEKKSDATSVISSSKRPRIGLISSYKEANPMTKITVGTTILLMLVCIIVILSTVTVSKSRDQKDSWNEPDVTTHHDIGGSDDWFGLNMDSSEDTAAESGIEGVDDETESPTSSPSYVPTSSPMNANVVLPNTDFEYLCSDKEGKFRNSRGKRRNCSWLVVHTPDALYSDRLDLECLGSPGGEVDGPSELALNCPYTCRAYNGCLKMFPSVTGGSTTEKVKSAPKVQAAPSEEVQDTPGNSESSSLMTNFPTYSPRTDEPSLEPSASPVVAEVSTNPPTVEEMVNYDPPPTFLDIRGIERECWWLDIRNQNQRLNRRNANCIKLEVQMACPGSCADYITNMAVASGQVPASTRVGGTHISQASTFEALLRTKNGYVEENCVDKEGYYLNNEGIPQECSWLTDSLDPTDESRRISNCGYPGSDFPEPTDLGKMCIQTCGLCGL